MLGHDLTLDEDDEDWRIYADLPHRNLALWLHWENRQLKIASSVEVLWQKM
jgi:hypothetical protein